MLLSIVAAAMIAQASPSWHSIKFNGQDLTVWGVREADGKILWYPNEQPPFKPAAPRYQVNGVKADKLNDTIKLRASDPKTLAEAIEQAGEARKPSCPEPSKDEPEAKPAGPVKRAEDELINILTVAGAAILGLLALGIILVTLFRLSRPDGD